MQLLKALISLAEVKDKAHGSFPEEYASKEVGALCWVSCGKQGFPNCSTTQISLLVLQLFMIMQDIWWLERRMIIFCVTSLDLKLKKNVSVSILSKAATGVKYPASQIRLLNQPHCISFLLLVNPLFTVLVPCLHLGQELNVMCCYVSGY